jgi:hypothetical protein
LNEEGYSKLNQFIRENVKAVLAENRKIISVFFAAIIQTLKADPEMVNLIQNIASANDGEQYKDNNNNISRHLEFNKNSLLYLAEKNYEDLVEVLTNNDRDTVITESSSNPTLALLPQSLLTYPDPSNQIIHTEKKT